MRRHIWAGLDVGAETTSICVINDEGMVLQETTCRTSLSEVDRELRWLRRRRLALLGMEASTGMHLARGLRSRGYKVDLYETRKLSRFLGVRRNKTDAGDALGIAEASRRGGSVVARVHLKSLECQALQSRLTIRRHLVQQRVASLNLLCRQIEHYGGRISGLHRSRRFVRQVEDELSRLFGKKANALTRELRRLLAHVAALLEHQRMIDQELAHAAKQLEVCRRLMTIPGIGPLTALTFYAVIGDPDRFQRSARIGAYFGLTPKLYQSGLTFRLGRISKMGNRAARQSLVGASKSFMMWSKADDSLRLWTDGIQHRRGWQKARVALARKLACVMLAMWKSGQDYQSVCTALSPRLNARTEPDPGPCPSVRNASALLGPASTLSSAVNDASKAAQLD